MWTFTGGSLFGGVLVMGLSFISPWSKFSDPSFNIVPAWDMCPNSSTFVTSSQEERLSLLEERLREMIIDVKSTTLMAHVSLYINNHIQEAVSFLNESLNMSAESRFDEVLRKQDEIVNKTEEYKQNITAMIAQKDRQCRAKVRNAHKTVVRMLDTVANKTEETFKEHAMVRFVTLKAIDISFMKVETWGSLVVIMGVLEFILLVLVCKCLSRPTYTVFNPPPPPQILVPVPYR